MKIKYMFIFINMVCFFTSCYKDNSATDFKLLNPIKIDFGGVSTSINLFQFDTLELNPIVYKNGIVDDNMSYEWKIQSANYDPIILANTMTLKAEIALPPNPNAYELLFTVRDATTTIEEAVRVFITVNNSIGSGLFVADTKDEINSDISLISSFNFSSSYTAEDPKYVYSLYSRSNGGEMIPGIIKDMQSLIKADSKTFTILTDNDVFRVDPSNMVAFERNNDLFYTPIEGNMKPIAITLKPYWDREFMNIEGKIYSRASDWGNTAYSFYLFTPENHDYKVSQFVSIGEWGETQFYVFDEILNKFYGINDYFTSLMNLAKRPSTSFDPNNIGAYDALYMGEGQYASVVTLFKSEMGKEYFVCSFDSFDNSPILRCDLTNCENIDKAVGYFTSPISNDFFYATDRSVYALSLTSDIGNAYEKYTLEDTNDKITSIRLWRSSTMMYITDELNLVTGLRKTSASNQMIIITTYNETKKEGKIIILPIIRVGDGTIDRNPKTHTTYTGFGRITSVTQNKTER